MSAISTLLLPEASEARTLKQNGKIIKLVEKTFCFTISSAMVIGIVFFLYSKEIGMIFYKTEEIGFYIKWLAPLIPFMYTESAIVGMMQGLNQQKKALEYNIIDSILRIILIYIALPIYGIKGFLVIMYVSNIFTSCINSYRLLKVSKAKFKFNMWIIKPILSAISGAICSEYICKYIIVPNLIINITIKAGIIVAAYIFLLFLFGIIEKDSVHKVLHRKKLNRKQQLYV